MLKTLWTRRQLITTRATLPEPTPVALSAKAAGEVFGARARLADTDGRLRRMRQTVDDNRLL